MPPAPGPTSAIAVAKELERVMRADRGRLLAILAAHLRDLSLAEEVLQEAAVAALAHWGRSGLPDAPAGWLLATARRKAIDRLRGATRDARKAQALLLLRADEAAPPPPDIPDERLRLIFACCHPALDLKSRVALTLRSVCGLATRDIARLFLDAEPTMGQRLSRAKAKIAAAGIPFAVPEPQDWPARLEAVLTTIYLIFTTGYLAGPTEPRDLCAEAEFLMRLIDRLNPNDPEIEGALAMILLTGARRAARVGADGTSLPPALQDRLLWDQTRLAEGRALLDRALARRNPGPFQIKAAIADCQMAHPAPDWPQIAALYQALWQFEPTPIVTLNAAVALAESGAAPAALDMVNAIESDLQHYQPFFAAKARVLTLLGQASAAQAAYDTAIALCEHDADRKLLERLRAEAAEQKKRPSKSSA